MQQLKIVIGVMVGTVLFSSTLNALTLESRVSQSTDDVEEKVSSGSMKRTSSDLELIKDSEDQVIGIRFENITLPQGATINNAYIQFEAKSASSADVNLQIHGEKVVNATTFGSAAHSVSTRSQTTTSTNWSPAAWASSGDHGVAQQSANIASLVQEIVDQGEWSSGNAMAFVFTGSGTRRAYSFDGKESAAPLLHIEYNTGGGDTTPPVITLVGNQELNVTVGTTYNDAGVTANDDTDGDITGNVVTVNPVDTNTEGTYTITYNVSDAANNNAVEVTRTVHVVSGGAADTTPPVITVSGTNPLSITEGTAYTDAGATATDDVDGDVSANITTTGAVDVNTPATYTITYSVTDTAGNTGTATRTVTVTSDNGGGETHTVDSVVSGSTDDAEETVSSGKMKLTSSDLELVEDKGKAQVVGVRFANIDIPNGATITNAYLQFKTDETDTEATNLVIHGEKVANAAGYESAAYNISSRTETTASANWSPAAWSSIGEEAAGQQSTSIVSIVQEIVDQGGWSNGNAMAFMLSGSGKRVAESKDGSSAPKLHIEYTTEVADTTPPVITLIGNQELNVTVGTTYNDAGVTANDDTDGDITGNVVTVNPVDTNTEGTYTITYNVSDAANNNAVEVTRTVHVVAEEKIIYEDAENENIAGWAIYDSDPEGASITNIYDNDSGSRVIELNGAGKTNAYQLAAPSGSNAWNNKIDRIFEWDMKISESFKLYVAVNTNNGVRYLVYTHNDIDGSNDGFEGSNRIVHGLGADSKNGTWQTFRRDLVADLAEYDENSTIESVNAFRVYGSGKFDNIQMVKTPTPNDNEAPVITLNGDAVMNIAVDSNYTEAGATALDALTGNVEVVIDGAVDTSQSGTYILTYTARDRAGNSDSITRTVNVTAVNLDDVTMLLNEYNAVASNKKLKSGGEDTHFGQVDGNGGAWMEMIVVGEHVDLRGARLKIKSSNTVIFEGTLPNEVQFGHLRKGTIVTISNEENDMSYAPFNPTTGDWTLNLNSNEMNETVGTFEINSSAISMELISNGASIMVESGENMVNVAIDNQEVFKLRKDPTANITPIDSGYGDDLDQEAISTFGEPNSWKDENGDLQVQDFSVLRGNRDLEEIDGIALFNNSEFTGLRDPESLLYVPINNTLWISDDNSHKVYEMDLTTNVVKNIYTSTMLEDFSGVCVDENGTDIPDCLGLTDLESVVYDDVNDTMYIFSGKASSIASIFKLTRPSTDDSFVLDDEDNTTRDYRILGSHEYQAAQFVEGEMIIAIETVLYSYNFETDAKTEVGFETTGPQGHIYGMAYDGNGAVWMVTSKNYLLKLDWATKTLLASYHLSDNGSTEAYNGVYDTRGLEIVNNKLYILEGMNAVGKKGSAEAPYGNSLKAAIHIYNIPADNL